MMRDVDLKETAPGGDWLTVSSFCLGFSGIGWSPVACAPFFFNFIILFILKMCCFHPVNVWHKNKMSQSHDVSADHWNSWCALLCPSVLHHGFHLVKVRANCCSVVVLLFLPVHLMNATLFFFKVVGSHLQVRFSFISDRRISNVPDCGRVLVAMWLEAALGLVVVAPVY